ncbi:ABC transporter permease [Sediminicola luteus]|uniref:Cell division protein FtsX n=1 Tax=Sediminicola luteus TaxID=319238 RepID=A0A2A4GC47_9FLAO|nr:ABC transporter permease [Sediminicola luteus]PCE66177.1 cell division protein FtsX [Sediminicola luteus]
MFTTHLKIAWRNLRKNALFSLINIFGLSIGLAITLLLFLFISHELSYNSMYPKKDRIHRILIQTNSEFDNQTWATAPPVMASALTKEVTNVESAARLYKHNFGKSASIRANEKNFTENMFYWVDHALLDIFDINMVKGNSFNALTRPNTVILSESAAKKYFADQDPIGQILLVDNSKRLEVTGVYQDHPKNSTLDAEIMASSNGAWFYERTSWGNVSFETYCLLKEHVSLQSTEIQMAQMLDQNVAKEGQWYSLSLQPLDKIHLYSASYHNSYASYVGDIGEVRNLGFLAILILLIACINYMNLTTAKSQKRAKEVGVSKAMGAQSKSLFSRFYIETGLVTGISVVLGVLLAMLLLPAFNALTDQNLSLQLMANGTFIGVILGVWLLTTVLSGIYPSVYLSRFLPKEVLSPSQKQDQGNILVRKGLVVLQFAASVILIVGVLVIYKQTQYIQNKELGFSPENVMAISIRGLKDGQNKNALAQEFRRIPDVKAVSFAQGYPGLDVSGYVLQKDGTENERGLNIQMNTADSEIAEVLQLKFLSGRSLPKNKSAKDTLVEVVLNKKALDYLGFTAEEAIGKNANIFYQQEARIVGIVDDFNFASLHEPIGAYAFHNNTNEGKSFVLVRLNTTNLAQTVSHLKSSFSKIAPNLDFSYSFLDQNLAQLYQREKRAAKVSIIGSVLAITVACLGLFGLAAFTVEQRRKEIGVRKVLGASVMGITHMLSKEFVKLVLVAMVLAFPLAYWIMSNWLEGFAYRINIGWIVFVISGAIALIIALLTVSVQSINAALTNPAKSIRTE